MKEHILAYLPPDFPWRDRIHYFPSIDSTNTRAKSMALADAPHGTVLIAGHQTDGRGRRGRSFHSPEGMGIYMSILLRPNCLPAELMHLTCAAAVAMCDAIENAAAFRPGIKWTNDLVYGKRKLAGILTELGFNSLGKVSYAIVGIGINCCQSERDFPEDIREIADSLSNIAGQSISQSRVAAAMLEALWRMDQTMLRAKDTVLEQYRRDCITLGQEVSIVRGDEVRYGKALDIDNEGALVVQFSSGHVEAVNSGEVSVRGMYGYM